MRRTTFNAACNALVNHWADYHTWGKPHPADNTPYFKRLVEQCGRRQRARERERAAQNGR
jgi:hypothetical protein